MPFLNPEVAGQDAIDTYEKRRQGVYAEKGLKLDENNRIMEQTITTIEVMPDENRRHGDQAGDQAGDGAIPAGKERGQDWETSPEFQELSENEFKTKAREKIIADAIEAFEKGDIPNATL